MSKKIDGRSKAARRAKHEKMLVEQTKAQAAASRRDDDTAPARKLMMRILSIQDGLVRDEIPVKSFGQAHLALTEGYLLKGIVVLEVVIA